MKEMTEQQALLKLSALCAQAEHCSYEMTEKMRRWGLPDEAQARIMARLTQERYIDDERYSRLFVREKIKFNKWGRRKVAQALMAKRIDHETIRHVLDDVDDDFLVQMTPRLIAARPMIGVEFHRRSDHRHTVYRLSIKAVCIGARGNGAVAPVDKQAAAAV